MNMFLRHATVNGNRISGEADASPLGGLALSAGSSRASRSAPCDGKGAAGAETPRPPGEPAASTDIESDAIPGQFSVTRTVAKSQ